MEALRVRDMMESDVITVGPETTVRELADILRPGTGDYVQLGGMYERLADCIPDIGAALDFVARRGYRQVILLVWFWSGKSPAFSKLWRQGRRAGSLRNARISSTAAAAPAC